MPSSEDSKSRVKDFVGAVARWLGAGESDSSTAVTQTQDKNTAGGSQLDASPNGQNSTGLSRQTLTVAEKMAAFRKAMDFVDVPGGRLEGIHSSHDLLLFLYEVLFFRFVQLKDLGLLNESSVDFLDLLGKRFTTVLSRRRITGENDGGDSETSGASGEPRAARQASGIITSGVVTENELRLEAQVKYLQGRVREQHAKLQVARHKFKLLASYQEMILSLRARNGLLTSKLDHQSRLLHSLAADNPKHGELFATVDRLREENARLKNELDRQTEVFQRLQDIVPTSERETLNGILANNADLQADLQARDDQLEQMTRECGKHPELLCYIDSLTEQNTRLKEALAARNTIQECVDKYGSGDGDSHRIVETLRAQNHQLEMALAAREEQINALASDPINRQLKEAFQRLQLDHRQVLRENQLKEQLYRHELQEKQALLLQLRETSTLTKENQRLRSELETTKQILDILKKRDFEFQVLKKKHSELISRYERISGALDKANQKLAKVTAEYNLLIKEYENIFGNR